MNFDLITHWLAERSGVLFAAFSGAAIQAAVGWQSPVMAARQFFACVLAGMNFGPAVAKGVEAYTSFSGASFESATICATGLCGMYLIEGLTVFAKRWSQNPTFTGEPK
jgi:hypothetical protein